MHSKNNNFIFLFKNYQIDNKSSMILLKSKKHQIILLKINKTFDFLLF